MSENKISQKVLLRHHILTLAANFKITLKQSAKELSLSYRQVLRLFQKFIKGRRKIETLMPQKTAWNKTQANICQKVIQLHELYPDMNNCHLSDLLESQITKKISDKTVRNILIEGNHYQPRFKRRRPRKRFEMQEFGQLIQMDTSEHPWIPTIYEDLNLIAMLDDFSRDPLAAFIFEQDTTWNNMKVIRYVVEKYGIFEALYSDNDSIFTYIRSDDPIHITYHKDQLDVTTQLHRALTELGITLIRHRPKEPQCKGKVERFFGFLQDRFVNELKRNIDKIPKDKFGAIKYANKFLYRFISWWRTHHIHSITKCRPIERHSPSVFKPVPPDVNLDDIFCYKWKRTVNNDNTFQFGHKTYQITKFINKRSWAGGKIELHVIPGKFIRVFYEDQFIQQFPYIKTNI